MHVELEVRSLTCTHVAAKTCKSGRKLCSEDMHIMLDKSTTSCLAVAHCHLL